MNMGFLRSLAFVVATASLIVPLAATSSRITKPVSFAILEDYDKSASLSEIAADFALFKELEIHTWRGSFGWDDYEPARGKFDFAWLKQFVELAGVHGIKLRPYLGYTPDWAARPGGQDQDVWNNPPRDLDRFARYASEIAGALRPYPHVLSYEIYNEENVAQWWDGTATTYAQLMALGSRAIRREDRDASILFGGLVYPDMDWMETVCGQRGAGAAFDVLPFHAYPETWTPADVTVENYLGGLDEFLEVADDMCGRKPIWINETGFATVAGKSEKAQAQWWVRAVATFLAHPRVEHIGVYEIKDLPTDKPVIGDAPNYHLGLTRSDGTRKMAFATVDMLTDLLDTGTLHVLVDHTSVTLHEGKGAVFHHLFERPDGDRVLFIWARGGDRHVTVTFTDPISRALQVHLDGRTAAVDQIRDNNNRNELSLALSSDEPLIFRFAR
jgi:hypothetical protein